MSSDKLNTKRLVSEDVKSPIPSHASKQKIENKRTNVFQDKTRHSDLILGIENEDVHVSRAVLSLVSPVFSAMFESEFQEKSQDKIDLPGKTYNDFVEFLECIYPNILKPVTAENVYKVTPISNEYQTDVLKGKCQDVLLQHMHEYTSAEELLRHLHIAERYGLSRLEKRCITLASELTVTEMKTWTGVYPVSIQSQHEMKELALMRYEFEREDNTIVYTELGLVLGKKNLRPRISQMVTESRIEDPQSKGAQIIQGIRMIYKYFPDDHSLKATAVNKIRNLTLSAKYQAIYDLLPETIKHEIQGKYILTIGRYQH